MASRSPLFLFGLLSLSACSILVASADLQGTPISVVDGGSDTGIDDADAGALPGNPDGADAAHGPTFLGVRVAAATTGTALEASLPAAAAGDLIVAVWVSAFANNVAPTGWDALGGPLPQFGILGSNDAVLWIGSRTVSDPKERFTFTQRASGKQTVWLLAYRGARAVEPVVQYNFSAPPAAQTVAAPAIRATRGPWSRMLYVFASTTTNAFPEPPQGAFEQVVPAPSDVVMYDSVGAFPDGMQVESVSIRSNATTGLVGLATVGIVGP